MTRSPTVRIGGEKAKADAYVMALGSYSARWMRKRRVPIPVYPIKGYSITFPVANADAAPVSTVMDETYKVAITRLGDRIRVGGTAEVSGYDLTLHESRRATLEHSVGDLFPDAGAAKNATFWCGLRPMTPDGPPIIGRDAVQEPLRQYRPRHAWLDHGVRLRQGIGRHHVRSLAGHRCQPTGHGALRLKPPGRRPSHWRETYLPLARYPTVQQTEEPPWPIPLAYRIRGIRIL